MELVLPAVWLGRDLVTFLERRSQKRYPSERNSGSPLSQLGECFQVRRYLLLPDFRHVRYLDRLKTSSREYEYGHDGGCSDTTGGWRETMTRYILLLEPASFLLFASVLSGPAKLYHVYLLHPSTRSQARDRGK